MVRVQCRPFISNASVWLVKPASISGAFSKFFHSFRWFILHVRGLYGIFCRFVSNIWRTIKPLPIFFLSFSYSHSKLGLFIYVDFMHRTIKSITKNSNKLREMRIFINFPFDLCVFVCMFDKTDSDIAFGLKMSFLHNW